MLKSASLTIYKLFNISEIFSSLLLISVEVLCLGCSSKLAIITANIIADTKQKIAKIYKLIMNHHAPMAHMKLI
jgi:hypothetical protein